MSLCVPVGALETREMPEYDIRIAPLRTSLGGDGDGGHTLTLALARSRYGYGRLRRGARHNQNPPRHTL
jgi:hypothetical protein